MNNFKWRSICRPVAILYLIFCCLEIIFTTVGISTVLLIGSENECEDCFSNGTHFIYERDLSQWLRSLLLDCQNDHWFWPIFIKVIIPGIDFFSAVLLFKATQKVADFTTAVVYLGICFLINFSFLWFCFILVPFTEPTTFRALEIFLRGGILNCVGKFMKELKRSRKDNSDSTFSEMPE